MIQPIGIWICQEAEKKKKEKKKAKRSEKKLNTLQDAEWDKYNTTYHLYVLSFSKTLYQLWCKSMATRDPANKW